MSTRGRSMRWMLGAGLVVGAALVGGTTEARQRPDLGQLDTSFNPDARLSPPGTVVDELLLEGDVGGLALQPGGNIVGASAGFDSVDLFRRDADGQLDRSFGIAGYAFNAGIPLPAVVGIEVQGRGRNADLVTVGGFNLDGFFALRHTADGEPDASFGDNGRSTILVDDFNDAGGSAIQPDGKVLVVGNAGNPFADEEALVLGRFDVDGGADTSFGGGDGIVSLQVMDGTLGFGVAVQDDGRIVAVGQSTQPFAQGGAVMTVARFLSDGTLDPSFGSGSGYVNLEIGFTTAGFDVEVIRDEIYVSGTANADDKQGWVIAKFQSDGDLDTSFGAPNGFVTAAPAPPELGDGIAFELEIKPNGSLLAAGSFGDTPVGTDFYVAGFHPDGTLDDDFGDGGFTSTEIGSFSQVLSAILQPNGRLLVGGSANVGGIFLPAIARYIT